LGPKNKFLKRGITNLGQRHPPLHPPSPSPCRPHPFCHMLPSLVDCFFSPLFSAGR
jgi:hypothetical protein